MKIDISKHPCFNIEAAKDRSRVHLPVAPGCNLKCNFCDHRHDCMNESRPGVSSAILSPTQALSYLDKVVSTLGNVSVVGIAGPGDPFANHQETLETLKLVRAKYPEILLCVATNGLEISPYIEELARLEISHITITVNAVLAEISAKIYAWARIGKKVLRGIQMGEEIILRQLSAIEGIKRHGIIVKINTIMVPGINDQHILDIAKEVKERGADIMNLMPMYPVKDTPFYELGEPSREKLEETREKIKTIIPQMMHCGRCRADAAGLIGKQNNDEIVRSLIQYANESLYGDASKKRIAVASMEGVFVNQHLGEAQRFWIFEKDDKNNIRFVGHRAAPEPGEGDLRWEKLANILSDCRSLLVNAAGPRPKSVLAKHNLPVLEISGTITESLNIIFENKPLPSRLKSCFAGCGKACSGDGRGCG